jgi:hypothetical protein
MLGLRPANHFGRFFSILTLCCSSIPTVKSHLSTRDISLPNIFQMPSSVSLSVRAGLFCEAICRNRRSTKLPSTETLSDPHSRLHRQSMICFSLFPISKYRCTQRAYKLSGFNDIKGPHDCPKPTSIASARFTSPFGRHADVVAEYGWEPSAGAEMQGVLNGRHMVERIVDIAGHHDILGAAHDFTILHIQGRIGAD